MPLPIVRNALTVPLSRLACAILLAWTSLAPASPVALRGQFSVDASGMANYSLPLQLPPGVNGLQPQLSLEYTGSNSNGLLGVGWQLGGGGSITRCGATPAQDGRWGGINFDNEDRLCLGGRRLMLIAGSYLTDNAEYRFEIDDFTRIRSRNEGGALWFEVTSRQGMVSEYGRRDDARLRSSAGQTVAWGLSQVRDPRGNRIEWQYDATQGWKPQAVRYGFTDRNGTTPAVNVRFEYEDRNGQAGTITVNDDASYYLSGTRFGVGKRLRQIVVEQGGQPALYYSLEYEHSIANHRSRLKRIVQGGTDGNKLLPLELQWQDVTSITYPTAAEVNKGFGVQQGFPSQSGTPRQVQDVNGDGLADVIGFAGDGISVALAERGTSGKYKLREAVKSGGHIPGAQLLDVDNDSLPDAVGFFSDGVYVARNEGAGKFGAPYRMLAAFGTGQGWGDGETAPRLFGDINGDGMVDIVGVSLGEVFLAQGTGGGFAMPVSVGGLGAMAYGTDMQAACRLPMVFRAAEYQQCRRTGSVKDSDWECSGENKPGGCYLNGNWNGDAGWYHKYNLRLQDVSGDGLPDLLGFAADGVHVAVNHGKNGFQAPTRWSGDFANWGSQRDNPRHLADVNRDGLPDIVGFSDQTWVALNTGGRFETATAWSSDFGRSQGWSSDIHPRYVEDVNGDGLPDVIGFAEGGVYLGLNNGKAFDRLAYVYDKNFGRSAGGWSSQEQYPRFVEDLNGDGLLDVIGFASSGTHATLANAGSDWNMPAAAQHPDRLIGIVSGGQRHTLRYSTLSDPTVYQMGAMADFPDRSLYGPIPVLSQYTVNDGNHARSYRYRYGDLRAELGKGRGVSGFAWIERTDQQDQSQERTDYFQRWPFSGRVDKIERRGAGSGLLSKQEYAYTNIPLAHNRVFVASQQQIDTRYEADGGALPSAALHNRYDCEDDKDNCYGNLLRQEVKHTDGWVVSYQSEYQNNLVEWLLGLPKVVTETRSNGAQVNAPVIQPSGPVLLPLATASKTLTFSTPGEHVITVPTDQRYARMTVRLVGGGGGGSGGYQSQYPNRSASGGGGGAGRFVLHSQQLTTLARDSIKIVVGIGGLGSGGSSLQSAGNGSATSLLMSGRVVLAAEGGGGGQAAYARHVWGEYEGMCGGKDDRYPCKKWGQIDQVIFGMGGGNGGNGSIAQAGSYGDDGPETLGGAGGKSPLGNSFGAGGAGGSARTGPNPWASGGAPGGPGYAEVTFEPFANTK